MKIYRSAKVGLLIGLLSFNVLSVCVNAKRELGWNCASWNSWMDRHPIVKWTARTVFVGSSIIGGIWLISNYLENRYYEDPLNTLKDRTLCFSIDAPYMSMGSNSSHLPSRIMGVEQRAIEVNKALMAVCNLPNPMQNPSIRKRQIG